MSEAEKTEGPTPGTAVAVTRERLIAQAPVAIWDSADFEQMQRVGVVLARSGLVPESLCKAGDEWLPETVVAARCVLICNQARLWGADPLNVLQCTSLINGRLMYEGKLINAIVQHLTGVKLRFELGRWATDHFEAVADRSELNGIGEALAIRCYDPEDEAREVSGSAGMWKTTRTGSPWSSVGNWPRQLRYRAVREWARAYEPGAILGILAEGDEEIDFARDVTPRKSGVMERLSGEQTGDGFNADHVERETGGDAKTRVAGKRAARKAAAESAEGAPAAEEPKPDVPGPETQTAAQAAAAALEGDDLPDAVKATGQPAVEEERQEPEPEPEVEAEAEAEGGEEDEEALPPEFATFADAVEEAESFVDVKAALQVFFATATFRGLSLAEQNHVRLNTWQTILDKKAEGHMADLPDHAMDVSSFRLWIEWCGDPEAITGTLAVLEQQPGFAQKEEPFKAGIRGAVAARVQRITGA